VNVPAFHGPWKYVQTIGLSVFNKKITTSPHFGWLRASFRVLYNINDMKDKSAYIVVGDKTSYWRDDKLFIFDDTLLHLSANESDQLRYCMFVDILRPSPFPRVMSAVIAAEAYLTRKFNLVTRSGWTLIERQRQVPPPRAIGRWGRDRDEGFSSPPASIPAVRCFQPLFDPDAGFRDGACIFLRNFILMACILARIPL
jgi:hypothetical protein